MIKSYVSKVGVSLVALALVVAPSLVLAQTAPLAVSITSPSNGATVTVGQAVSFSAQATGGVSPVIFGWTFSDGSTALTGTTVSKTFNSVGQVVVSVRATDTAVPSAHSVTTNINVNVVDASSALVISNIQKSGITKNSAVITWDTNRAATSRVIYDTATHVGVNGATVGTAPNYDYANSTTRDDAKVTSHSVTLSGLTPNTKYYFRVLSAE